MFNVADFLLSEGLIVKEEKEAYNYGFDFFVSEFSNLLLSLLVGVLLNKISEVLVINAVFVSVRRYSGGYHANTRIGCKIVFLLFQMVVIGVTVFLRYRITFYEIIRVIEICCCIWLIIFAPVVNKNKIISKDDKIKNKKKLFIILLVINIIQFIFYYFDIFNFIVITIQCTVIGITILFIYEQIKNIRRKA